jgi:hypothetical protein
VFARYADKREQQAAIDVECLNLTEADQLWFDYVADVGDGFDPTITMASLLAQDELVVETDDGPLPPMPRGALLVMGGDQVYPFAEVRAYEDRFKGPYTAVRPEVAEDEVCPQLLAIPGNHDWYDGLTAFLRIFGQGSNIGSWQTAQTRSYFAVALPANWWLFGIDIQLDTYIDQPQLEFFRDVAERLQPGDGVILCSAKPSWVEADAGHPDAYDTLDYFERTVIAPTGASVRLSITGDLHHYARYLGDVRLDHKITAGGGGAFLSATHHLPKTVKLPPVESRVRAKSTPRDYTRACRYPDARQSRQQRRRIFHRIWANWDFLVLPAVIYGLLALSIIRWDERIDSVAEYLERIPSVGSTVLFIAVFAGLVTFTKEKGERRWLGVVVGGVHAILQLVVGLAVIGAWVAATSFIDSAWQNALVLVLAILSGAVIGTLVFAVYLFFADRVSKLGVNGNELFAAMRITDFKCFLRMFLDSSSGELVIYPIKVERVPRWRFRPNQSPWYGPEDPVKVQLLEPPITITREVPP